MKTIGTIRIDRIPGGIRLTVDLGLSNPLDQVEVEGENLLEALGNLQETMEAMSLC